MIRSVHERKQKVSIILARVNAIKSTSVKHDQMCFCYVLVYGTLEFMIETIIRGWIQHHLKKHSSIGRYRGKRDVDRMIVALQANAEKNLELNNTIKYDKICGLLERAAGGTCLAKFKALVAASSDAGANDTISRIERISLTRHRLAHGIELPQGISPNISELENDFEFLYKNLIKNLDQVLPRK